MFALNTNLYTLKTIVVNHVLIKEKKKMFYEVPYNEAISFGIL